MSRALWPTDARERELAAAITAALRVDDLKPAYRRQHGAGGGDAMTGHCFHATNAFWHAMGGPAGPYLPFQVTFDEGTHWFLVDTRKLPRGWRERGAQPAFRSMACPASAVVDLTAAQFRGAVPYAEGSRRIMRAYGTADAEPTKTGAAIMARATKAGRAGTKAGRAVGRKSAGHRAFVSAARDAARMRRYLRVGDVVRPDRGDLSLWEIVDVYEPGSPIVSAKRLTAGKNEQAKIGLLGLIHVEWAVFVRAGAGLAAGKAPLHTHEMWGSSHEGSRSIATESARILGLSGYERAARNPHAERVASDMLRAVEVSPPSKRTLYSSHSSEGRFESLKKGDSVALPLLALTDRSDIARSFSSDAGDPVLFVFKGAKAFRYSPIEWITAGSFTVERVRQMKDPFWKTPLMEVVLRPTPAHEPGRANASASPAPDFVRAGAGLAAGKTPRPPKGAPTDLNLFTLDKEVRAHEARGDHSLYRFEQTSVAGLRRLMAEGFFAPAPGRSKGHWLLTEKGERALEEYRERQRHLRGHATGAASGRVAYVVWDDDERREAGTFASLADAVDFVQRVVGFRPTFERWGHSKTAWVTDDGAASRFEISKVVGDQ